MQTELEKMFSAVLTVAQDNLSHHDGFGPFALVLQTDADVLTMAGLGKPAESGDAALRTVENWLRQQARTGEFRAFGWAAEVAIDVQSPPRTLRAIRVWLEHVSGEAAEVYVPFEKHADYHYLERIVLEREPSMFGAEE